MARDPGDVSMPGLLVAWKKWSVVEGTVAPEGRPRCYRPGLVWRTEEGEA